MKKKSIRAPGLCLSFYRPVAGASKAARGSFYIWSNKGEKHESPNQKS